VTQEPFKTPYYVALLLQLSIKPDSQFEVKEEEDAQTGEKRKAEDDSELDCGRDVLENLSIAYRTWVEGREWLNVRQCVCSHSFIMPVLMRVATLFLSPTSSGCY
jgi:nuclear cap-binding protein subunit 1